MLGGQISVNLGAAVAKQLFPVIGVEGITAYRVGFSALLLMLIFRPWRQRLAQRDMLNLLMYGSVLGLMNLLIYRAFNLIPIGIAVAIEVTGPLAVAMLSSRRPRDLVPVAGAAFGLYLLLPLSAGPGHLDPAGIAYALGAALCWALYIIFGKRAASLQGGQAVAWGMLAASLFTVPLGIAYSGAAMLAPGIALTGLAIAVLSSMVPYTLEIFALRNLPQAVFGMFSSAAPAVSALAGMLVLGEHLSLVQWLAIACIVSASASAFSALSRQRAA
ncbi:inner membrane transporter rhtA [Janthinobacterium agaricidamnosum NBRC 102515 = DSM 9628]|uniref:Inner membrane transporter rhtA n=1 Tax=Janthinobacterium agaricidamnosum NBRC 102515 = DSM 9628 TaxID=1349767 RepID=W0V3F7_9BURK|nr:inner membrane transporter rhtA [Janthinobacterium agaricidamnosum NBRC 102515 = DSM 9628]